MRALKLAEDAYRVQFIEGGYLSVALITTHRPPFAQHHHLNVSVLQMGRACAPIR